MKKFWFSVGLVLILAFWGGLGYYGLGICPAQGQPYYYCDPNDPNCYYNYYSAPYQDPYSQFFYYVVPQITEELRERRERREHERFERRERGRFEGRERERRER